jgi:hypothetical protein
MTQADVKPAQSTGDSESPQPSPHSEEQAALCSSQSSTVHEIIEPHSVKKVAVVVLDIPVFQTVDTCPQTSSSEKADSAGSIGVDIKLGQASIQPPVLPELSQSQIDVPKSLPSEVQWSDVPRDPTADLQAQDCFTGPVAVKTEQVLTTSESEKSPITKAKQVPTKHESEGSPITPDSLSGLAEMGNVVEAMVIPARTKSKPAGSPVM